MLNQKSCWEAAGRHLVGGVGGGGQPPGGGHICNAPQPPRHCYGCWCFILDPATLPLIITSPENFFEARRFSPSRRVIQSFFFEILFMAFVKQLAAAVGTCFIAFKGWLRKIEIVAFLILLVVVENISFKALNVSITDFSKVVYLNLKSNLFFSIRMQRMLSQTDSI